MTPSSSTLRRAADLQERIERLQQELDALLRQAGEAAEGAPRRQEDQKQPAASPGRGLKHQQTIFEILPMSADTQPS